MRTLRPCLSSPLQPHLIPLRPNFQFSASNSLSSSSFLLSFRPKRFHFLKPCSSLKETKKQTLQKSSNTPQSLRGFLNLNPKNEGGDSEGRDDSGDVGDGGLEGDTAIKGTLLAGVLLVGFVGGFAGLGYVYKEQINSFLTQFSGFIEGNFLNMTHFGRSVNWVLIFHSVQQF